MKRKCPAALLIEAELECDRQQRRYDRTRSHRALEALKSARMQAIAAALPRKGR